MDLNGMTGVGCQGDLTVPLSIAPSSYRLSDPGRPGLWARLTPSVLLHAGAVALIGYLTHAALLPEIPPATVDMVFEAMAEPPAAEPQAAEPAPRALPPPEPVAAPVETARPPELPLLIPAPRVTPPAPQMVTRPLPPRVTPPVVPRPVPAHTATAFLPSPAPNLAPSAPVLSAPAFVFGLPPPVAAPVLAVSGSWRGGLMAWIQSHKHYPEAARQRHAEGQVTLRITVTAAGDIVAPEVLRGSGSDMLDQAALSMVRGARVPPFPPDMSQSKVTLNVGVGYRLDE